MIPTTFEYQRASSLDDAIAKLRAAGEGAKILAGGHSLVPLMKLRMSEPRVLIDISRIPGLAGIRQTGGAVEIGAATTHHAIAISSLLREVCPVLAETAAEIGDPQVRNRGTIGGSLAHADPAADYPAAMLALDADILLKGPDGERRVKASDFFQGFFTVDLAPAELVVGVRFTPVRSAAYAKLHQRASHFAIVGVAAALEVQGGTIRAARIGLTGAATHAMRLTKAEQALQGKPAAAASADAAAAVAADGIEELNSDIHASADYRRAMIGVFTKRAVLKAIERIAN